MDNNDDKLTLSIGKITSASGQKRREYLARFVKAGRIKAAGNRQSNITLEPGALERAVQSSMFDGKAVFVDHAGFFDYPSLNMLAGVTLSSSYDTVEQAGYWLGFGVELDLAVDSFLALVIAGAEGDSSQLVEGGILEEASMVNKDGLAVEQVGETCYEA